MITITQAVSEALEKSPFLADALGEDVANVSKVARKIKKQVEGRLYEKVSLSSIVMAIHRKRAALRKPLYGSRFLEQLGNITVRSNLVEYLVSNAVDLSRLHLELSKKAKKYDAQFFTVSRGLRETMIVVSGELEKDADHLLVSERGVLKLQNLAAITFRLPEASLAVPGVYYSVLKALAMEGINFVEIVSVGTELSILFESSVVDHAFSVLKRLTA